MMSHKKFSLTELFHAAPSVTPEQDEQTKQTEVERLTRELAAAEVETRFREALARGEISGDIVMVDKQGNEIKSPRKRSNILGL